MESSHARSSEKKKEGEEVWATRPIEGIFVLDPACRSGAFLFAALNILERLYACLSKTGEDKGGPPARITVCMV